MAQLAGGSTAGRSLILTEANHSINNHANVVVSGSASLEVLQFDGTNWVNRSLSGAGIVATTGATMSGRLVLEVATDGDGGWNDGGILIRNTGAAGEAALAFNNSVTGSSYWIQGLNQSSVYRIGYGTSFLDSTTKFSLDTSGNATIAGTLTVTGAISGSNVTSGTDPGHTHTAYNPTFGLDEGPLVAGANIISALGLTNGVITNYSTRVLTPSDIGASPDSHTHAYSAITGTHGNEDHSSNFLTANQTITLTGDITGSGTTAITTSLAANTVTNTELDADFASDARVLTYRTADGIIWEDLSAAKVGLGNVENIALSTWVGSANITTVGTLSSGAIPWTLLTGVPTYDNYNQWLLRVDDNTAYAITANDTLYVLGGTGIGTAWTADDQLTISIDSTAAAAFASLTTTGDIKTGGTYKSSDNSSGIDKSFTFVDIDSYEHDVVIKDGLIVQWNIAAL